MIVKICLREPIPEPPPGASYEQIPLNPQLGEIIAQLEVPPEVIERYNVIRAMSIIQDTFFNEIINECPNKRVAHLARFAKKKRVRKKNYNRACDLYARK